MDKQKNTKLGYSINTFMLFAVNQQPFSSQVKGQDTTKHA